MNQEIKYSGLSTVPSDHECPDGSLAVSINLLPENDALQPILAPSKIVQLEKGEAVKFIHKTSSFEHYIIYSDKTQTISFKDKKSNVTSEIALLPNVTHFNAVGNTLLAFTHGGFYYYLWKNNKYIALGDHLPEVEVSFGLVGHPRLFSLSDESKSPFRIYFDGIQGDSYDTEFSESNKARITEQVMAKVNKFVAQETVNKGRFCFPFFVRYALRLYDGSLVHHSAPILMNPSTKAAPIVWWNHANGGKLLTEAECDIMLVAASLDYNIIRDTDYYHLNDWSDIIKSIDVFVSKPIYTYDQSGKISTMYDTNNYSTKFIGRLYAQNKDSVSMSKAEDKLLGDFSSKKFLDYYCEWEYSQIFAMYYSSDRTFPSVAFHLPEFTDGKVGETLKNTSTFYKLYSIELSGLTANDPRREIVVENEYLQSLTTREVMTDDYLTHDQLHADYSFVYNNRLNLAGIRRKPYKGFLAQSMFAYCNGRFDWGHTGQKLNINMVPFSTDQYTIVAYIKENGEDYCVTSQTDRILPEIAIFNSRKITTVSGSKKTEKLSTHSWGCYVFYPNPNAYKLVIYNYNNPCYAIELKQHEFLNGAFAVLDYEQERKKNFSALPNVAPLPNGNNFPVQCPNKIYTSEVSNPFYFPVLGINSVGSGEIKGICSAAKALSQGQFGQFPLYAFTTEGVWALEVSSTGTYSARQPITRDVCINSDGITQLDSAVLFPTDRGIMLISGSQTQCISEAIDSQYPFDALRLPGFQKLHDMLGHKPETDRCLPTKPFKEFLQRCRMLYDYVHQRVIVYAPGVTYAYVYSLKSHQWGMLFSNISSHLNSYPDSLAMDSNNALVSYSIPKEGVTKCLYVSRPLKLEMPNILKTIDSVIQRGLFRYGHVSTVLYGSRDLQNWHLVWTSRDQQLSGFSGSPFKYFRVGGVATLSPDESLNGASVQFMPRQTNKPR